MQELNIEIDPDAFVVHPESKYEFVLQRFIDDYDDIYTLFDYIDSHSMTMSDVLELLHKNQSSASHPNKA